jgi:hypothetical protein
MNEMRDGELTEIMLQAAGVTRRKRKSSAGWQETQVAPYLCHGEKESKSTKVLVVALAAGVIAATSVLFALSLLLLRGRW